MQIWQQKKLSFSNIKKVDKNAEYDSGTKNIEFHETSEVMKTENRIQRNKQDWSYSIKNNLQIW